MGKRRPEESQPEVTEGHPDPTLPDLSGTSLSFASPPNPEGMLISVQGSGKSGKTDWSLRTCPGPIAYFGLDDGARFVFSKLKSIREAEGVRVASTRYEVAVPLDRGDDTQIRRDYTRAWEQFVDDYRKALNSGFKTIVIDTASELWEWVRLATFGKTERVPPILYTVANTKFRDEIRRAQEYGCHLILIHKEKDEYVNVEKNGKEVGIKTGSQVRSGFREMEYIADVFVRTLFDPRGITPPEQKTSKQKFGVEIMECRFDPGFRGQVMPGMSFDQLAGLLLPEGEE